MELAGASVVVTGGASGLGRASAEALLRRGAIVTIGDLGTSTGAQNLAALGDTVRFVPTDVTVDADLEALFAHATERGPVRAVVHTAGRGGDQLRIVGRDGTPSSRESFENVIRVNLIGTYNVLRHAAAAMRNNELVDDERGACVLTASVAAYDGQIGQTAYAASKAGVVGMTLVAARDLASFGVRVNTIAPGVFETPMLGRLDDAVRDGLAKSVPYPKRLGLPEEYAALAVHLLENTYMNGETIRLDGAMRMPPR
jgi:NAD(P)-dependent dehydrogenase (short-subunit alcohol dehydrogenase family)